MNASIYDHDDAGWLQSLIRHVPSQDVAGLCAVLEGAEERPQTGAGRLLSFYIGRARMAAQEPDPLVCQPARAQLEAIRAGLAEAGAQPDAGLAPPVPAAPPPPPAAPAAVDSAALADAIRLAYRLVVQRAPAEEEVGIWLTNFSNGLPFHEFLLLMHDGAEAREHRARSQLAPDLEDADFIQGVYRHLEGRGALPDEIDIFRRHLGDGTLTRAGLVQNFFSAALARDAAGAEPVHDGLSCAVMGTGDVVTLEDWRRKAQDADGLARARAALRPALPFRFSAEPGVEITAIASLFRGGDFIEQFMDNITSQTCFDRHCELIIVDAESPENEVETIARYLDRHPGVRYQRMNSRVGIYEAWNIGVQMARGRYLTNTNLDDLRRRDSLEIQAGALQALPFADVVYQDFYYSFDPGLDWEGVAAFGYRSDVPVITPYNMLRFNSPHNAPMWRRSLHDELGLFDASFRSAGDYEFWMRCLAAGKTFYKVNEPHVVYYQNPKGLSTRSDTRGLVEARAILRQYAPHLIARAFAAPLRDFAQDMLGLPPGLCEDETDRGMLAQRAMRDLARRSKSGGAARD